MSRLLYSSCISLIGLPISIAAVVGILFAIRRFLIPRSDLTLDLVELD